MSQGCQGSCDIRQVGVELLRPTNVRLKKNPSDEAQSVLENNYPEITGNPNTNSNGTKCFPKIEFSSIPHIVHLDFDNDLNPTGCLEDYMQRKSNLNSPMTKNDLDKIMGEYTEREILHVIKEYYKNNGEDVFILSNQDLHDLRTDVFSEKDIILVNRSRGYFLALEAKATLNGAQAREASRQLQHTTEALECSYGTKLTQKWNLVRIIYSSKRGVAKICNFCNDFVICKSDNRNIMERLDNILSNLPLIISDQDSAVYASDYVYILKNILPIRANIGKQLLPLEDTERRLKLAMHEKISENVKIASDVQNLSDWASPDPKRFILNPHGWRHLGRHHNLVHDCLVQGMKKVLFDSGYSTGRTKFLMECTKKLVTERSRKVVFVVNSSTNTNVS